MKNFCLVALVSILIVGGLAQECNRRPQPTDLLQSGTIQVQASATASPTLVSSYDVPITYPVPNSGYQVTAAISEYAISNTFANGFDFSVRGGSSNTANVAKILLLIRQDLSWTKISISYLITSREDLRLGHFIAEAFVSQHNGASQLTFNYGVPNWQSTNKQVVSVAQFAGLRTTTTAASPFNVRFTSSSINTQTGQLTLILTTNATSPFDTVHVAYFWWLTGPTLAFQTFNPTQNIALAYKFVGIQRIDGTQIGYQGSGFNTVGFLNCQGPRCTSPCLTPDACVQATGIINGNKCFRCAQGETVEQERCLIRAPVCSKTNEVLDPTTRTCVCRKDTYKINGVCVQCPQNERWDGQKCDCLQNFRRFNGQCSRCPPNAVFLAATNECKCNDNFYPINELCVTCDANSVWDSTARTCVCKPGYFGTFALCTLCDSSCNTCSGAGATNCLTCKDNRPLVSGKCQPAPPPIVSIDSRIALTGTIIANGQVYQGISMTQVPTDLLVKDCVDCANLLRVLVIANGVTVTSSVSYVRNSQYWFLIKFSFPDVGLTPVFQYTVQFNPAYANYFTPQTMVQRLFQTIDPVNIPKTEGVAGRARQVIETNGQSSFVDPRVVTNLFRS